MYSHSPLDSVTYYVGRVEGEASVPRVPRHWETVSGLVPDFAYVRTYVPHTFAASAYCVQYISIACEAASGHTCNQNN